PGAVTQTITPAGDSLVVLDKRLNKDDAVDIVRQLLDVQNKAKTLGRLLKLPRAIIEVTPQLTGDPQAPLFYIIDEFLKQVDPRPTWRLILNALRDPLIGEHSLAQEIEMSLTPDITSPSLPAASLSQSSFPTSVPNSTSPADVLQSTTAAAALLPALSADSQSLSVSQSISTVSVSRSKLPGTGSRSPGDSTQRTRRSQEMAKPTRTHFRAPSPASTSVVQKSRSRAPSSGSLRKKDDYSRKVAAPQKFISAAAKPQSSGYPSKEISTGAAGGHSSVPKTQHSTKHKSTRGKQSSGVVSRTTHGMNSASASRTRESGGSSGSSSSLPTAVAPTASDMPLSVTYNKPTALSISSMPEMEKRILQRKVNADTNRMIEQYALLRAQTESHLHEIHCDVKKLLVCIMDVQHVRHIAKESPLVELEAETSISGVFLEMVKKSLISFLQFSILKRVITELCTGSQELQEKLKAYESEFNDYIRRRVCETSIYHEGRFEVFTGGQSDKKVELLIITDKHWDYSIRFVDLLDLEALVAKCLNIDRFNLQMFRIEPNCLRIRYAVSIRIAKTVFPLTNEEWKQLSHHGIIKIHCQEYFYTTDDKVGALPFKTND
ncbi:hypothetical protein GBAR_LOCUS17108, partial [Geodia barretti]